jgi:hypothetical protein
MEGVNIHFDHAQGKTALGHQLVTSRLTAGKYSLPLDFELDQRNENQPDFKSKNELAQALIAKAVADGFCFDRVVWDVWYFNFENTSYIEGLGKDWLQAAKSTDSSRPGTAMFPSPIICRRCPKKSSKKSL